MALRNRLVGQQYRHPDRSCVSGNLLHHAVGFWAITGKMAGYLRAPLLVNPLVIDFAFSQYRLALAISILGAAYLLYGRYRAVPIALVLASLFIHSGTTLFILIYAAVWVANWLSVRFQAGCSAVFLCSLLLVLLYRF